MKLLITGGNGLLAFDLKRELSSLGNVISVDIEDFDITHREVCREKIMEIHPDIVIHAAAYTQVDECESFPEKANQVNAYGAKNVAEACRESGAFMVYYSSDYIFDGTSPVPYSEEATPRPLSVYGRSKWAGEQSVMDTLPDHHLIARTAWLFGRNGRNFVDRMIQLAGETTPLRVVDDQVGCPTYASDLARATQFLLSHGATGIYNVTNSGHTTWYGFASYFLKLVSPHTTILPIRTSEYPLPATRPSYSVLSTDKYVQCTGVPLPSWQEAVVRYLNDTFQLHV